MKRTHTLTQAGILDGVWRECEVSKYDNDTYSVHLLIVYKWGDEPVIFNLYFSEPSLEIICSTVSLILENSNEHKLE